ncbi:hypothetical protein FRUB_10002 [Fimbriiglobus ruber]|uniref:Uncharacterized protein n=1 Tax=Fimbriiglobus ruber TaxID=1908690 RepID=A0A225D0N3_9BACT|nr:hypothetical protein FRUB_10002 [Fimbriiglobus ruber]
MIGRIEKMRAARGEPFWNAEHIAQAKQLRSAGKTLKEIAKEIGGKATEAGVGYALYKK